MLKSLSISCPNNRVYVLCLDAATYDILSKVSLPSLSLIRLEEVEDKDLLSVKPTRNVAEYCWTLAPCFPWYLFQTYPHIGQLTYLDADLYFYSPLQPLFDEIEDASIAIIEHRFGPRLKHWEINGRFCVEWVSFRRDEEGLACLKRWRAQCIDWCFDRVEERRMGDQKYLDEWPAKYSSCHILGNIGAGLAPWNYEQYQFSIGAGGQILVDKTPLIFYHFHGFHMLSNGKFDRLPPVYAIAHREPEAVYSKYEHALQSVLTDIRLFEPAFCRGLRRPTPWYVAARRWISCRLPAPIKDWARLMILGR